MFDKKLNIQVKRLLSEVENFKEPMSTIFEKPIKTTNLDITNEQYENYEAKELITSELPQFSKYIR